MTDTTAPALELSRAERRRRERDARKAQSALLVSVSRVELSKVLAPLTSTLQMHDAVLGFLMERGLAIRQGRAVLDTDELNEYLAERNGTAKPPHDEPADFEKARTSEELGDLFRAVCKPAEDLVDPDEEFSLFDEHHHDLIRFDSESPAHA